MYASARAFAFLSEYEGLGLTPLEALACGVPSVLLDTPIARESCGDAALYVPKGDIPATAAALERLLFDDATSGSGCSTPRRRCSRATTGRRPRDETLAVLEGAA